MKVGAGVKVAVLVAVDVEVLMTGVAVDVEVAVAASNNTICCGADPVGEGTGGRELPQILGRVPQPERMKASRMRVRRFRGECSKILLQYVLDRRRQTVVNGRRSAVDDLISTSAS